MTHLPLNLLTLTLTLALTACAIPKSLGDNPDEDSSGSTAGISSGSVTSDVPLTGDTGDSSTAESGVVPGTDSGSEGISSDFTTTTADGPSCQNPAQIACGLNQVDCVEHECGALGSPFDANGCLRPSCNDEPCGANEVCFGDESLHCAPSVISCGGGEGGVCECTSSEDCGGRYCYPAGEAPPADCGSFTDSDSCLAAGCSEFQSVTSVNLVDGACDCSADIPACLWFAGEEWGGAASAGAFYHLASQQVVVFGTIWIDPPYGWVSCGDPGAPAACACALDCE